MEQVREILSKGSSIEQLQSELATLGKEDRQTLLGTVFGKESAISIPADAILAMKADLSINWSKLRGLRRYCVILNLANLTKHHQVDEVLESWLCL